MINGRHFSGAAYEHDRTENRNPTLGIIDINPNFEAIAEPKITSQTYEGEFGRRPAGVICVQTRSGTNNLHGSGFEFYQGDRFQSGNPFSQATKNASTGKFLPKTKRNQYGGSLGGP